VVRPRPDEMGWIAYAYGLERDVFRNH